MHYTNNKQHGNIKNNISKSKDSTNKEILNSFDPNDISGMTINGKPFEIKNITGYSNEVMKLTGNLRRLKNASEEVKMPEIQTSKAEQPKLTTTESKGSINNTDNIEPDVNSVSLWDMLRQKIQQIKPAVQQFKQSLKGVEANSKELELVKYKISEIEEKLENVKNGKIHLNTKEIIEAEAQLERLNNKKKKLEKGNTSNSFSGLKKAMPFMNDISGMTIKIKNQIKQWGSGFKNGLGHVLKYAGALFSLQGIYSTLSSCANTWLSSQNAGAKQLSANIEYMKYAMGSALAPVIQFVTNLVYQLMRAIQSVAYVLTGVNIFANASAKAYSSMAKSAKKASDALHPGDIDEVHNIQESNSGGSGGTGDVMPNIDLGQVDTKLNDFLKKLKEGKWYEAGAEIGKKINESLEKIPWESIKKKAGNIGKGIAEFINGGIKNTNWNLVGSTLGEGINTAITFLKNFITTLDFASIVDAVFDFLISAIATINWGDIAYTIFYLIGVNWGVPFRMLWNVISTSCSTIGKYFSDKISEAGGNVALGLWNGIIEGLGNIASWVYDNVIKPLIDGFKNGMGIHSPSTVMFELRKIYNARTFEPE